jgi:hypothetical protein
MVVGLLVKASHTWRAVVRRRNLVAASAAAANSAFRAHFANALILLASGFFVGDSSG